MQRNPTECEHRCKLLKRRKSQNFSDQGVSEKKVCSKDCKGRRPLIPKGHQGRGRVSARGTQLTRFSTLFLITRSVCFYQSSVISCSSTCHRFTKAFLLGHGACKTHTAVHFSHIESVLMHPFFLSSVMLARIFLLSSRTGL